MSNDLPMNVEKAYLSLGSNCKESEAILARALSAIEALPNLSLVAKSRIYQTEPQDYADQPWFANQVVCLAVKAQGANAQENAQGFWNPQNLLARLLEIEKILGRRRDPDLRFGPRVIDIDLLLFGQRKSACPDCLIPHPRMNQRAFVLYPLLEIAPDIVIQGKKAGEWLGEFSWKLAGDKIWQG